MYLLGHTIMLCEANFLTPQTWQLHCHTFLICGWKRRERESVHTYTGIECIQRVAVFKIQWRVLTDLLMPVTVPRHFFCSVSIFEMLGNAYAIFYLIKCFLFRRTRADTHRTLCIEWVFHEMLTSNILHVHNQLPQHVLFIARAERARDAGNSAEKERRNNVASIRWFYFMLTTRTWIRSLIFELEKCREPKTVNLYFIHESQVEQISFNQHIFSSSSSSSVAARFVCLESMGMQMLMLCALTSFTFNAYHHPKMTTATTKSTSSGKKSV